MPEKILLSNTNEQQKDQESEVLGTRIGSDENITEMFEKEETDPEVFARDNNDPNFVEEVWKDFGDEIDLADQDARRGDLRGIESARARYLDLSKRALRIASGNPEPRGKFFTKVYEKLQRKMTNLEQMEVNNKSIFSKIREVFKKKEK